MSERDNAGENAVSLDPAGRKPWSTPRVIISTAAAESKAKGPPGLEGSIFFSPSTNTPVS